MFALGYRIGHVNALTGSRLILLVRLSDLDADFYAGFHAAESDVLWGECDDH